MNARVKPRRRRGFTRLSRKHQVTLPLAVVESLGLGPGDELRVEAEGDRIVMTREDGFAARRRKAIGEVAGSLTGVYQPGYLESLRDEWR